jgi:hypothetical protein
MPGGHGFLHSTKLNQIEPPIPPPGGPPRPVAMHSLSLFGCQNPLRGVWGCPIIMTFWRRSLQNEPLGVESNRLLRSAPSCRSGKGRIPSAGPQRKRSRRPPSPESRTTLAVRLKQNPSGPNLPHFLTPLRDGHRARVRTDPKDIHLDSICPRGCGIVPNYEKRNFSF